MFDEVYDATESYRSKRAMDRIDCADLKEGDLIMIEASVARWPDKEKPKDEGKTGNKTQSATNKDNQHKLVRSQMGRSWERWRTELRLDSIAFLFAGSEHLTALESNEGEDVDI